MTLDVEVLGRANAPGAPSDMDMSRLAMLAAASAGVEHGHVAIEFVTADRITELNAAHRDRDVPTDVLSFPVDGDAPIAGPPEMRELGDVVICAEHTQDLREAVIHGVLHLVGMDHETDDGEMLALQAEILSWT
jgi:probable rRNA maturation factor